MWNIRLLLATLLLLIPSRVDSLSVLVVFPLATKSHSILGEGYARELLKAGHKVTMMTPFPKKEKVPGRTDISIDFMHKVLNVNENYKILEMIESKSAPLLDPMIIIHIGSDINSHLMESDVMKEFINDKSQNFDVVIVEWFFSNILISLGTVFQCPVVLAPSTEVHNMVLELVDSVGSPATSLNILSLDTLPYDSFRERVKALIYWSKNHKERYNWQLQEESSIYEKLIKPAAESRGVQNIPPYYDVIHNISIVLYNSHPSLGLAQAIPPNVIPIGGYHIERPVSPLPEDFQKLLDKSVNGVIYFSMGSILKSEDLPEEWRNEILRFFSTLKQTVLWKISGDLKNVPANVITRKWMPQQSILAHPNVKMFITHGGLLSTTEAIHSGVPLIGIPIFGDQFVNMERAAAKGYAVTVDASKMVDGLKTAVTRMLSDDSFSKTAKLLSSYYHDRPRLPGDDLVYWVEHAYRTKGAPHLKPITRNVSLYQKLYLDLLGIVILVLVVFVVAVGAFISKRRCDIKNKKD